MGCVLPAGSAGLPEHHQTAVGSDVKHTSPVSKTWGSGDVVHRDQYAIGINNEDTLIVMCLLRNMLGFCVNWSVQGV